MHYLPALSRWLAVFASLPLSIGLLAQTATDPAQANAERGRAIVANKQLSLCTLCHVLPIPEEKFQGNIGPSLLGVGKRYAAQELRRKIANAADLNRATIMPSYAQTANLNQVAANWADKPLLNPQQIDDVVAYLLTLRD